MSDMPAPAADVRAGFFRLPKVLFLDERYRGLSAKSKFLHALMLDRIGLSIRNGWADKAERAQRIYVKDFACVYGKPIPPETDPDKTPESVPQAETPGTEFSTDFPQGNTNKTNSAVCTPKNGNLTAENRPHGCRKPAASNTNFNKIDLSKTNLSIVPFPRGMPAISDGMERREAIQTIRENISYDILLQKWPDENGRIDGIVSLLADTVCSRRPTIRISGEEIPTDDVRERLFSLDDGHIEYIFDCMDESTVPIGNIRAYLLTALYNAPLTIDSYYDAKVRRDMTLEAENRKNIWTA